MQPWLQNLKTVFSLQVLKDTVCQGQHPITSNGIRFCNALLRNVQH